MGIAPYKTFTFDGESSGDYGVYITGTGVFNAPERSVEMVEIAGRNGSFALDKGKFENIEVTYRVGIVDDSEADFADRVSDFRNWLCSKVGYCRLEDEYNPNEYRMAVYASGIELEHDLLIAGEAEIKFDCKPQRWLTSGETAVSVADGGTIDNPTLFPSSPLLAVKGYGNIDIESQEITIENVTIGEIVVRAATTWSFNTPEEPIIRNIVIDTTSLNNNDTISIKEILFKSYYRIITGLGYTQVGAGWVPQAGLILNCDGQGLERTIGVQNVNFNYGTSASKSYTGVISEDWKYNGTMYEDVPAPLTLDIYYDGNDTITVSLTINYGAPWDTRDSYTISHKEIIGNSTKSVLGNPLYIDLDIGECWNEDSGEPVSVNNAVSLGSDLPKLASGTNTINYDNTITDLKIIPRWWKV